MSQAVDRVLSLFQDATPEKDGWLVLCPAHDDHTPSLRISEGAEGRALLTCRAGCTLDSIVSALGIKKGDLFEGGNGAGKPAPAQPRRFGKPVFYYDYTDEQGHVLYRIERDEQKNFRQRKPSHLEPPADPWISNVDGVRRVPYRLPEVMSARALGVRIHIVEGEKDAERLIALGLVATTNAGGAGKWTEELSAYIEGAKDVAILADNDQPGQKHAEQIAAQLRGKVRALRVVTLPGLPPKGDVSDYLDDGKNGADLTREIDQAELIRDPADQLIEISQSLREFMAKKYDRPRSILGDNVISAGDLAFLYGRPGLGKTYFALQMILALARGEDFLGLKGPEGPPLRIGILELELHGFWLQERMRAIAGDRGFDDVSDQIEPIARPDLKGAVNVLDPGQWSAWIKWIEKKNLNLVFVDALSRVHEADENKAAEFAPVLKRLDMIRHETGACVIPIHHEPKADRNAKGKEDDMDALRGTSRMQSDANCLMRLVATGFGDLLTLRFPKVNNAPKPDPVWFFQTKNGPLEVTTAPEQVADKNSDKVREVLQRAGQSGASREEIENATGLSRPTVFRHLKRLMAYRSSPKKDAKWVLPGLQLVSPSHESQLDL